MSNYFTLTLDLTGPNIQINAPTYTSRESDNIITVVGDETLSSYQGFYIVDSAGTRHDVTFSFDGDRTFTGEIIFGGYPIGVATIYAQIQDEVGNMSAIATSHISIITSTYYALFRLTMSEQKKTEAVSISNKTITINKNSRSEVISVQQRQGTLNITKNQVIVSETN